jgi:Histidine-specific methyltransferase, SAM-dependent
LIDWVDTTNTTIPDCRSALMAGSKAVPVELGLLGPITHIERGERECYGAAFGEIAAFVGPAARVIDCGPFAGLLTGQMLSQLERPKAGIMMTSNLDARLFARLGESTSTAQVTHIHHHAHSPNWPLETIGAGKTLVMMTGGSYGLASPAQAFAILENASHQLQKGDFVALTLEMVRDAALIDAAYRDFGNQLVNQALGNLGRAEGLEARSFYDAPNQRVTFGATAQKEAALAWNGTRCSFDYGSWLDMGAMRLSSVDSFNDLHPDFETAHHWVSQDKVVTLQLLRKV